MFNIIKVAKTIVHFLLFLAACAETKRSVMLDPDPHTHVMNTIRIRNNDYRIVVEIRNDCGGRI
jgi:hypothetical protein